jgi:hypothetical protein
VHKIHAAGKNQRHQVIYFILKSGAEELVDLKARERNEAEHCVPLSEGFMFARELDSWTAQFR